MKNIPHSRFLLYILIVGVFPLLFIVSHFSAKQQRIKNLQQNLFSLQHQVWLLKKKQAPNAAVQNHYRHADHFYIDKYLETLSLQEPELESLQAITNQDNFIENAATRARVDFLSHANRLVFSEGAVQAYSSSQETLETLVSPVEVNVEDIKKILSRVEGVKIGPYEPGPNRPLLIITDFKIDKKKTSDHNEVFSLNLKLLKREFS